MLNAPWDNNACILDAKGRPLKTQDYPTTVPGRTRDISIMFPSERSSRSTAGTLVRPARTTSRKLQHVLDWCKIIVHNIPWNYWAIPDRPVRLLELPTLSLDWAWNISSSSSLVTASYTTGGAIRPALTLQRNTDGRTWHIATTVAGIEASADIAALKAWERMRGLVLHPTPRTALYPWEVPTNTRGLLVTAALRKQRSRTIRLKLLHPLQPILDKLSWRQQHSTWGKAALQQSPTQLWQSRGLFTEYQCWTIYRITIGELNLFHSGWPIHRDCPEPTCPCQAETIDHIVWTCEKAQLAWQRWVSKWLGRACPRSELTKLQAALATRTAPGTTHDFLAHAQHCIPAWTPHHDEAMMTIWRVWATVTPVLLWRLRNDAVFNNERTSPSDTSAAVWSAGIYQLQAIGAAWKKSNKTRIKAWCLETCLSILTTVDTSTGTPAIEHWLLRCAISTPKQATAGGGWILYQQLRDGSWAVHRAGSMGTAIGNSSRENARQVIIQALQELLHVATPATTYVRIEGHMNIIGVQARCTPRQTDTTHPDSLAELLGQLFSVQWGKPPLQQLRPATLLAQIRTTTTYDFRCMTPEAALTPLHSYLLRTARDLQPCFATPTRQPVGSIQSRLIAYQATIGQK